MNLKGPNHSISSTTGNPGYGGAISPENDVFFKRFFYNSPLANYACDQDGYIIFYNPAAAQLWGREPQLGVDRWCGSHKIYYPEGGTLPPEQSPMAITLRNGITVDNTMLLIERPDQSLRTVMVIANPVFDDLGNQVGANSTLVDMTDKSMIDKKQVILSAIVASSDNAIISKNLDGIITSWNVGAEKIFGYNETEIVGKSITILIPEELMDEERQILRTLRAGLRVQHLQTIRVSKDGRRIPISLSVSPLKDEKGTVVGASKIARDITEEIRSQQMIRRNTENLEILNAIGKVIVEKLDVKVILQQVTDATTKITGADFGAFFYNSINEDGEEFKLFTLSGAPVEAFSQFGMPRNTAVFDAIFNHREVVRSDDITKDARYGNNAPHLGMPAHHLPVVSYLAVPVVSKSGSVIGSLLFGHREAGMFTSEHEDLVGSIASQAVVALDNSRLFEEVQALSAKKDEFIALASHELKTPITSIKGYLQISSRSKADKKGQLFVDKALSQVERLNSLVTDLLDSSKIVVGKLQFNTEEFDIFQSVREVLETFHYSTPSHQLIFEDPELSCFIKADRQRIEQVLSNLINNAIKYSPKADKVYISTAQDEEFVTIKIKDEGIGLENNQLNKIFNRFYRADAPVNISGLGLGLYLTKGIIDRHGGTIHVESEPGKGSLFSFALPLKK